MAFALPAIFAIAAIALRLALAAVGARHPVDLAQPLPVATNWYGDGALIWAIYATAIAAAALPYLRIVFAREAPSMRTTLFASACALVALLCAVPLLSSDVYAYAAYGEMARLHLSPYAHHALPHDPFVAAAYWQWSGTLPICVYGEGFVAVARAIVTLGAPFGVAATLDAFRALACVSLLLCAWLTRDPRAAAFITLNPVALVITAEGHNDTLALACVLAGAALLRRFPFAGAAIAAAAASIKAPALAPAWVFALRGRRAFAGACAGTLVALAASAALLAGVRGTLAPHGVYAPFASAQSLSPLIAIALGIAVLARALGEREAIDRWTLVALALWLAIPNPYAWYALWLIALAAFSRNRRVVVTVLAVAAASVLRYIPDAVAVPHAAEALALGIAAALAYVPLFGAADA